MHHQRTIEKKVNNMKLRIMKWCSCASIFFNENGAIIKQGGQKVFKHPFH